MFHLKIHFKKESFKNRPSRELFAIAVILFCVLFLELFTPWDELLLSYVYQHSFHPLSDLIVNAMLAGLLFSIYSIRRFFEYKDLIRKKLDIELSLKKSQHQLEIILANSATIAYTVDPSALFGNSYTSPNVKWILGYEPEEFRIDGFWMSIIHPEDGRRILERIPQFMQEGIAEYDLRVKHKDGSWRLMSNRIKLIRDASGTPLEVVGSWLDITEKKQNEKALHQSEERFQLAAKGSKDVIYDWDIVANTCWTNDLFSAFGEKNSWDQAKFIEKIHPEDRSVVSKSISAALEGKRDYWSKKFRLLKKDDTYAFVYSRAYIVYSEEGMPVRWIGTMSDITSIKEIENRIRVAKEKAEESTRAKSEFLANMSHEIRTPLNGIIGMTELTLETALTPQQERYLGIVKSSSETLMGLINDILDFSKIDAGKFELAHVPFSLREDIPKSLQALGLRAAEKGLEFIFRMDVEVPDLFIGDILRIQQIIMNLAGNAIKFTEHGEVIVHVQVQTLLPHKAILQFSVSDTGIGIPSNKLSHIFDEFTQVDNSTSRKYGGTGLGLAITRKLVNMMKGSIQATSIEGKESRFQFTIELKLQKVPIVKRTRYTPALSDKSVLVVQGNRSASDYSSELLNQFGISPVISRTGDLALVELKRAIENETPYSLVLLDTNLQGTMDGFTLAEELKNDKLFHQIPVVVVSMSQKASDREWFAQLGYTHFLSKPFSPSDLLDNIQSLLAERKSLREVEPEPGENHYRESKQYSLSVLLAEDNVINQEVAISMLKRLRHKVKVAANGKEAVAAVKKEKFDIILMDVQMPLMNGYEATQKIRSLEKLVGIHTHIIGLTANAMSGDKEKCLNAGMDDYISKPMHLRDLASALDQIKTDQPTPIPSAQ